MAPRVVEVESGVVEDELGNPAKLTVDGTGALKTTAGGGGGGGTVDQGTGNPASPWYSVVVTTLGDDISAGLTFQDLILQLANDVTVQGLSAKFPYQTSLPPTDYPTDSTAIGVYLMGQNHSTLLPELLYCDDGELRVTAAAQRFTTIARTAPGTAYEEQNGTSYGCSLGVVRVFIDPTTTLLGGSVYCGYILLLNQSAAAVGSEEPFGACVFPVKPGEYYEFSTESFAENFTLGIRAVFSTTPATVTLGGAHARFTVLGLP